MNNRLISLLTARPDGQAPDSPFNLPENHRFSHVFASHSRNQSHVSLDRTTDTGLVGDGQTTSRQVILSGQTSPFARLTVQGLDKTVVADRQGQFRFTDVLLSLGNNRLAIESTDIFGRKRYGQVQVQGNSADSAQVIIDWNDTLLAAIVQDKTAPPKAARAMAIVNAAIYDAVNAIAPAAPSYWVNLNASPGASVEAAASEAAYQTLKALFPNQTAKFDAKRRQVPESLAETAGRSIGQSVATAILNDRRDDGNDRPVPYVPSTQPDAWRSMAPGSPAPTLPQWPKVRPFSMTSGNQFRPAPPPAIESAQFRQDLEEVRRLGSKNSSDRTADQTQTALFWADGAGSFTPPGHWIQITRDVAKQKGNSLQENARLFAQVSLALADAGIAAWDAKYTYNQFRPIQAIRNGGGNWTIDANWTPLIPTPNFSDYVSGHSTFSGAASQVLARFYGDGTAFTTTSPLPELAGVTRSFTAFSQAADEAGRSRIYGGIHWETSNQKGLETGRSIGNQVFDRFLIA
jgi:hypothetical protein